MPDLVAIVALILVGALAAYYGIRDQRLVHALLKKNEEQAKLIAFQRGDEGTRAYVASQSNGEARPNQPARLHPSDRLPPVAR